MLSAALAASVVFANAWDGVLIKGRTDKDNPVGYKSGEQIVFTLVASEVPAELENAGYMVDWKRTGDDGKVESGKVPFKSGEVCRHQSAITHREPVHMCQSICVNWRRLCIFEKWNK